LFKSLRHKFSHFMAPSSLSMTCAFRHSAHSRALNDSMYALYVGFLVLLKSNLTSSRKDHASRARDANYVPLSTWITDGLQSVLVGRLSTSIMACEGRDPTVNDRQSLARVLVGPGQHAKRPAVLQRVVPVVHALTLGSARRYDRWAAGHNGRHAAWVISRQIKPLQAMYLLHALVGDQPTLAAQRRADPRRSPDRTHRHDLLDPNP
jgi:hypothetical protein